MIMKNIIPVGQEKSLITHWGVGEKCYSTVFPAILCEHRKIFWLLGQNSEISKADSSIFFSSEGHPAEHSKNLSSLLKKQGLFDPNFGLHVLLTLMVP